MIRPKRGVRVGWGLWLGKLLPRWVRVPETLPMTGGTCIVSNQSHCFFNVGSYVGKMEYRNIFHSWF